MFPGKWGRFKNTTAPSFVMDAPLSFIIMEFCSLARRERSFRRRFCGDITLVSEAEQFIFE